jgi:hypothetical protein
MNVKKALFDIRDGLRGKYPPSCILEYFIDTLTENYDRSVCRYIRGIQYAPCSLHMRINHQNRATAMKHLEEDTHIDYNMLNIR